MFHAYNVFNSAFFYSLFSCYGIHFDSLIRRRVFLPFQYKWNVCVLSSHFPKTIALLQIYDLIMNILYGNCIASMHCCHNANSFRILAYMWILWWFLSIHTNYVPQSENSKIMILFDKESIFPATQSTRSNLVFDKNNKEMNTNSEVDCKLHNIDWIVMRCFYRTQQFNDIVRMCLGKIYDAQWSCT